MSDRIVTVSAVWFLQADTVLEQLECAGSAGHAQQLRYVLRRIDWIWSEVYGEEYKAEKARLTAALTNMEREVVH